jgi:hypothetical protein
VIGMFHPLRQQRTAIAPPCAQIGIARRRLCQPANR